MSYRLKHKIAKGSWVERTYCEKIYVVDGECEVEREASKNALLRRGYEIIEESSTKSEKSESKKKAKKKVKKS